MFGEKRNFDTRSNYKELEKHETIEKFKKQLTKTLAHRYEINKLEDHFISINNFGETLPPEQILSIIIRKLRENPEIKINELDDNEWEISVPWMLSNTTKKGYGFFSKEIFSFSENGKITINLLFPDDIEINIDAQHILPKEELSYSEVSKIIDDLLNKIKGSTDDINKDFFNNLTDNEKSVILDRRKEEIRKKLEEDYIVLLDKVIELKNVVSIVNQFQNTFGEDTLIKDILTEIPQELRATVFPYRKTSIKLLAKQLIELDEKRYKLHRKIEQFRFLFENGVTKEQTALDIYWQHEESNKQRYKIAEKIFAYPRISINSYENGYSIAFGMTNEPLDYNTQDYHSFINEDRSRRDDFDFTLKLSKIISDKYPLIQSQNLYEIYGSFHYPLHAFELFISNQNLEAQSHELKTTPEKLLHEIYDIVKEELTKIKNTD